MAAWTTIAMVAGTVISAAAAGYQAYTANEAAGDAKRAAGRAAEREEAAAQDEAAALRDKTQRLASAQRAALAASGGTLGDGGTSDEILGETERLGAQDVLAVLKEGRERAGIIREQGQLTAGNYRSQAVASALDGVSSIAGGVASYRQATAGSRAAAAMKTDDGMGAARSLANRKAPSYSLIGGSK